MLAYLKLIRRICYIAICAALLMICYDAIPDAFDRAKKRYDAKDFTGAYSTFVKLARQGDKRAQFYLGRMCHLGEGRAQDKQEAVLWYRMSAEQGFAKAQNNLGVLLLEQGDIKGATEMFGKALLQGLPQASTNLAAARNAEQIAEMKELEARPSVPTPRQNMNDPTMEFHFHRLREGLR